jgi:hypothetical protein
MTEHVYYIPLIDEIVTWNILFVAHGLNVIIDMKNNISKNYEIIYLGEL